MAPRALAALRAALAAVRASRRLSALLAIACAALLLHPLYEHARYRIALSAMHAGKARAGVLRSEIGSAWLSAGEPIGAVTPALASSFEAAAHAQDREDVYALAHFFWGAARPAGGIILESGALNGVFLSTTYAFETVLRWRAMHIEPGPIKFGELALNRPRSLNLHTALCDAARTLHFAQAPGKESAMSGIVEFMAPSFRERWWPELAGAALDTHPHAVPISCNPLATLLALFGITHVDFWVLDVEGGELSVLHTVDWEAVQIDVIVVELDGENVEKDEGVRALLAERGYIIEAAFVGRNTWFVSKKARGLRRKDESKELHEALREAYA